MIAFVDGEPLELNADAVVGRRREAAVAYERGDVVGIQLGPVRRHADRLPVPEARSYPVVVAYGGQPQVQAHLGPPVGAGGPSFLFFETMPARGLIESPRRMSPTGRFADRIARPRSGDSMNERRHPTCCPRDRLAAGRASRRQEQPDSERPSGSEPCYCLTQILLLQGSSDGLLWGAGGCCCGGGGEGGGGAGGFRNHSVPSPPAMYGCCGP
jgi:hypothetical protein